MCIYIYICVHRATQLESTPRICFLNSFQTWWKITCILFPGCCINTYNSPHHCVGFLFFAWIPPLLFPLPPRRFIPQLITPQLITAPLLTLLIADHTSHHILLIASHSSHHISHLTFHISHHISLITSLITSLLTSHSSHHNSSQLHFSHLAYHISHNILLITSHSSHHTSGALHRAFWRSCTQSILAELRRAWPLLARGCLSCGRRSTHPGGAAARVAAGGLSCGRRSTQSLLEELHTEHPGGATVRFRWIVRQNLA